MVYEFALTADRPVLIWSNNWSWEEVITGPISGVSLLRTCQQVNHEARELLLKCNTFVIRLDTSIETPQYAYEGIRETRLNEPAPSILHAHLPLEKIRNLELYMYGFRFFPKGPATFMMELPSCVNRCSNLRCLKVSAEHWNDFVAGYCLPVFIRIIGERLQCKANIEWLHRGGRALPEATKDLIRQWTSGKVTFRTT